jgi:histidine kinase
LFSVYPKIQHYRKGGEPFYVNVYAHKTGHTPKYGIIVTTIDITESMEKESQLIQASKMSTLGEMASGVAHELNQPLNAMQMGADFIVNVIKEGVEIPKSDLTLVSEQIREQVDRAVTIINHLREFGRKTEITRQKISINKPIEGVFTLLGQQLKLRGIKVVLDLNDNLPPVIGDINRLEQVFINLVMNARSAMEEKNETAFGGHVDNKLTVKSFQENGQVSVTITDTGTGIPDNIRNRIFEPFFTTKEVGKGTGLGLSISYGIVKDYGGVIGVESEVGKGTTFKISFPVYDEEQNGA